MVDTLRLHYAPDNASLCIRLALEACAIPYTTALVDRRASEQKTTAYRALNPNGLIPTLETQDGPIFETGAILLWLSQRTDGAALMPKGPNGAALSWLFWLSNSLHPALRMIFYAETFGSDVNDLRLKTQVRITSLLDILEATAADQPEWLSTTSAHGCYLCPMLRWLALYPDTNPDWYDLSRWPHLHDLAQAMDISPHGVASAAAEGLGPTPFSAPVRPNPPEGSAI